MTVHVGVSAVPGTVVFSDSQGSTDRAESHGLQKQIAGDGFLLCGAGSGLLIFELFDKISADPKLNAGSIVAAVRDFLEDDVEPEARKHLGLVLATPGAKTLQTFDGGMLRRFGSRDTFATIGSGADFVYAAAKAQGRLGIVMPEENLADVFMQAEDFARASDESLTVNAQYTIGLLVGGRSYLMSDEGVRPTYFDQAVRREWSEATSRCGEILALARTIRSEIASAQGTFSEIRTGKLSPTSLAGIGYAIKTVAGNRPTLETKLSDYMAWYDGLLGR